MKSYKTIKDKPLAKFFYKGNHTHPVRRTVVLIENHQDYFRGYELREGSVIRHPGKAPVKSYSKVKIASISQIDKRRKLRSITPNRNLSQSTLNRYNLAELISGGI